jgi:hypothetical protein
VGMLLRASQAVLVAPILALLMLLEPVVRWICSTALVVGMLVSLVFELSAVGPRFPFLAGMGISLGFGVLLVLFYGLISLVSPEGRA